MLSYGRSFLRITSTLTDHVYVVFYLIHVPSSNFGFRIAFLGSGNNFKTFVSIDYDLISTMTLSFSTPAVLSKGLMCPGGRFATVSFAFRRFASNIKHDYQTTMRNNNFDYYTAYNTVYFKDFGDQLPTVKFWMIPYSNQTLTLQ